MACHLFNINPLMSQCWLIINWILGNKFLWNIIQNTNIFCQENIVYKITAIFYDLNLLKQYQKLIVLASQATNSAWGVWLVL